MFHGHGVARGPSPPPCGRIRAAESPDFTPPGARCALQSLPHRAALVLLFNEEITVLKKRTSRVKDFVVKMISFAERRS